MKKKLSLLLAMVFVFTTVFSGFGNVKAFADTNDVRIAGGNRYATAVEIAKENFKTAEAVIIVRGDDNEKKEPQVVDGLTASVLAGAKNAPILLTEANELRAETLRAIIELGAKKAYVIGGELAISADVEAAIEAIGVEVERVVNDVDGFKNRFGTAAKVAEVANTGSKTAIITQGDALVDSLVAGPLAFANQYPILLVEKDSVHSNTEKAIKDLGIENLIIVGGPVVVSDAVKAELEELVSGTVTRTAGLNKFTTSVEVAKLMDGEKVALANVDTLVDAVAASTLGMPVIYVQKDAIRSEVVEFLGTQKELVALGGNLVISDAIVETALDSLYEEVEVVFEVVSVSAINGLEFQVTFSKPVLEADATSDKVKLGTVAWSDAELSEDGLVLTLTTSDVIDVENAALVIEPVKSADFDTDELKSEKYVSLFTYKDTVAPFVVKNEGKNELAEITFNEELNTADAGFGVSVDGVNIKTDTTPISYAYADKVLTINGLENGKTYKVEIVGAKDTKGNIADPINLTVTPVKPADAAKQNVAITASGNKVTLNFVNPVIKSETVKFDPVDFAYGTTAKTLTEIAAVDADAITYSNDDKTVVIDTQLLGVFGKLDTLTTKVTVDAMAGDVDPVEKTVTLTTDKVAPKLVKATATADEKLTLEFNEAVKDGTLAFDVTHIKGILLSAPKSESLTATYATDAKGNDILTTLVVDLSLAINVSVFQVGEVNKVKFADKAIKDIYANESAEFTIDVTVPAVDPDDETAVITVDPATVVPAGNGTQTLTLKFNNATKDLTDASASAANFTLGGKALPTGSKVEFVDNKTTIRITLPAGSIVTDGSYKLTLANIADLDGNTLAKDEDVQYVSLIENVAPTVKSVKVATPRTIEVAFSENISYTDLTGITVKVNGVAVDVTGSSATNVLTLTLDATKTDTINYDVADLVLGDKISVEFKGSTITDTVSNPLADVTVTN